MYPDGAGMRESRHGCLPLHLAAFASCLRPSSSPAHGDNQTTTAATPTNDAATTTATSLLSPASTFSTSSMSSALPSPAAAAAGTPGSSARLLSSRRRGTDRGDRLGGYQEPGAPEPGGLWTWVNGEGMFWDSGSTGMYQPGICPGSVYLT